MDEEIIRDDLFSKLVDATIARARNGDTESARKILKWFCGAIRANTDKDGKPHVKPSGIGTQIDEQILRYLGDCFQKILNDAPGARVDANHALGIVAAGRKGNTKTKARRQYELDIGYQVMKSHDRIKAEKKTSIKKPLKGESSLICAIDEVAKKHKLTVQMVRNYYDEWNKLLNQA